MKYVAYLFFKIRRKKLDKVIWKHTSSAIEFSFPPTHINAILQNNKIK